MGSGSGKEEAAAHAVPQKFTELLGDRMGGGPLPRIRPTSGPVPRIRPLVGEWPIATQLCDGMNTCDAFGHLILLVAPCPFVHTFYSAFAAAVGVARRTSCHEPTLAISVLMRSCMVSNSCPQHKQIGARHKNEYAKQDVWRTSSDIFP